MDFPAAGHQPTNSYVLHHVLQLRFLIILDSVNNQMLTDGRTIPKYRDAIASKKRDLGLKLAILQALL